MSFPQAPIRVERLRNRWARFPGRWPGALRGPAEFIAKLRGSAGPAASMGMLVVGWFGACALPVAAATYYTDPTGNDSASGTSDRPWRTIQKAANTLRAGDTAIVRAGSYPERVTTTRAGTASSRIAFQAEGIVTMRGWVISHPFVTVRGFHVTGHSAASDTDAHVKLNADGDNFELLECTVRDGIQLANPDISLYAVSNVIRSPMGGFLSARFAPGQTLYVGAATNRLTINSANSGKHTVTAVTDTELTVASALADQGPTNIYLSASLIYGLHFHSGATNALILGNTFSNLAFDTWYVNGAGHRFISNTVARANGWDIMHFIGDNHLFERNWFKDSPLLVYQPSPDWSENFGGTRYANVLFTNNYVEDVIAVIASQKTSTQLSGPLTYSRNVLIGLGLFAGIYPNTTFEHNTFLRVASKRQAVIAVARHPLYFTASAANPVIRNNIFVGCGEVQYPWTEATMGWYEILSDGAVSEGNFVASGPTGYGAKTGWPEGNPLLNGGDPGFADINNPLGPDGIPFTEDDGLRLLASSKLLWAGAGGRTIGAYEAPVDAPPAISIAQSAPGQLRLAWPQTEPPWVAQTAPTLAGTWADVPTPPTSENGQFVLLIPNSGSGAFYRLRR